MNDKVMIEELNIQYLREALSLVWKVFFEFEAPDYSREGIAEFKEFIKYKFIKEKILTDQVHMWTCTAEGKIVGVLAVRPACHISLLFVDKHYHRNGIARAMLDKMILYYKKINEHSEMTVNSSPYAKEVYHKLVFFNTDTEQIVNGIKFIPMKRLL